MATTNNLGITLIEQSQAQKEVTANEAFVAIDAVVNSGVIDKDLATPPISPNEGDIYIVASSGTGDWTGKDNNLAYYYNSSWKFITPNEGITLWVRDEDVEYTWDGTAWILTTTNFSLTGIDDTATTTQITVDDSNTIIKNNAVFQSTFPVFALEDTDALLNEKVVRMNTDNGVFSIELLDDSFASPSTALKIDRTGTAVDSIEVNATNITNGTLIARQNGGIAGTDEVQFSHNGTNAILEAKSGRLEFVAPSGVRIQDSTFELRGGTPTINFQESDQATNEIIWQLRISSKIMSFRSVGSTNNDFLKFNRGTGENINSVDTNTNFKITTAGKGLYIKEGTNARMGSSLLSSGVATVSNTSITANTRIFLTPEGSSTGAVRVSARVAGSSFTITSSDSSSTDKVHWVLVEPA